MLFAIILFAVTYVLMFVFPKYRPFVALGSAAVFVASGILPISKVPGAIDWNVLMMIAGTMGLVALLIESKMPSRLADVILGRTPNVKWAILALSLFAGIVSAFIDNVATVLMIAPIALAIAKKLDISPVGMIIAISVSSNLQGAATLVGDTTSIMLGGYAGMSFLDFFWWRSRPGIFFAVELGALAAASLLLIIFRRETARVEARERTAVSDYFPSALMLALIALLIGASFISDKPSWTNGAICLTLMAVGMARRAIRSRSKRKALAVLREIDLETLGLLLGLFVVVSGLVESGAVDMIAEALASMGGGSTFLIYTVLTWASVLVSAFIDNIPYVATMLPVVHGIAVRMGVDPTLFYFGMISGATLGGNLTPVGASANITGINILRREGYEVKNGDFFKIGVPFTLAAVIPAYVYFWVVYG